MAITHRAMASQQSRLATARTASVAPFSRKQVVCVRAANENPAPGTPSSTEQAPPAAPFTREFRALGSKVIESNQAFEEPPAQDMWEGENFEAFGQILERWFLPGLVVLGLICGGYAASSYNNDADVFIKPASGPDASVEVVPASALQAPPVGSE